MCTVEPRGQTSRNTYSSTRCLPHATKQDGRSSESDHSVNEREQFA
jgi:hypothetical protein